MDKAEAKRLDSQRDQAGLSYRELGKRVGVSHNTVRSILQGVTRRPHDPALLQRIADAISDAQSGRRRVAFDSRALRSIPVLRTITAGEPWESFADVEYEEIADWGPGFERWGRIIEGDSMRPVFLPEDCAVFENRRAENGHVVHAFSKGRDTIKAYRTISGQPWLCPFNEDYEPIPADGWQIKGVVVARIRYGKFRIRTQTDFPQGMTWGMKDELG